MKKGCFTIILLITLIININLVFAIVDEKSIANNINNIYSQQDILADNKIISPGNYQTIYSPSQPKGFDLSYLSDSQVKELANLNLKKINIKKNIEKLRFNLNKQKTQGLNSLNPFLAIMNYISENQIKSEEKNLQISDNNLKAALSKYNIPIEVQNELDKINANSGTWIANYNSIFIKPEDYKQKISSGLILNDLELKKLTTASSGYISITSTSSSELLDSFDLRNVSGKNYITSVKDQGNCGSCWAFAATAVLEGAANAYYNNIINPDLSEQDLVSCFLPYDPTTRVGGCSGAYDYQIENLFLLYYKNAGQSNETCFPYTATNSDCSLKCSDWRQGAWKTISYHDIYLGSNAVENIKNVLINYGPVEVGMEVYSDLSTYTGGIYHHTNGYLRGYHAVTIVGYGKYDGREYWIVKNSWGSSWGEGGFFKILTGECEINSWYAYVIDTPVSPNPLQKICENNDNDGYCNWGLGTKPLSGCPICSDAIEDCDDTNSGIYQKCGASSEITGTLSITSEPTGADVYVKDLVNGNWIYRGQTPLATNLNIGNREVKLTKEDYIDYLTTVNINQNQIINLQANLDFSPKIIFPDYNNIFRAGSIINIFGSARSNNFKNYKIEYLKENNDVWSSQGITLFNDGNQQVINGNLGYWNTSGISDFNFYKIRLVINKNDGSTMETNVSIGLDPNILEGWPKLSNEIFIWSGVYIGSGGSCITKDLFKDGNKEIITFSGKKIFIYYSNGTLLNGWPQEMKFAVYTNDDIPPPSIGDIDGDGQDEIVYFNYWDSHLINGKVCGYAWEINGSAVNEWYNNCDFNDNKHLSSKVSMLYDIDNDKKMEALFYRFDKVNDNDNGWNWSLYIVNGNGTIRNGWPIVFYRSSSIDNNYHFPLVGDFNNDGKNEIVIEIDNKSILTGKVLVYNINGTLINSFDSQYSYRNGDILTQGDFDGDGIKEIAYTTASWVGFVFYKINGTRIFSNPKSHTGRDFYAISAAADLTKENKTELIYSYSDNYFNTNSINVIKDGDDMKNWPQNINGTGIYARPQVSDINNDGKPEIITSTSAGLIYAFYTNGSLLNNFPIKIGMGYVPSLSSTVIDDVNKDGFLEIFAVLLDGSIYGWKLKNSRLSSDLYWPMFKHDPQNTGCYDCDKSIPPSRPQSKIVNNGNSILSGNLTFILQKNNTGIWQNVTVTTRNVSIPANGLLKLDTGKDNLGNQVFEGFNNLNIRATSSGDYRIYARFESNGQFIESNYEFKVQ